MMFQPGSVLNTQGMANRPENVEVPHIDTRAPIDSQDVFPYTIGKRWIDKQNETYWYLANFYNTIDGNGNAKLNANWILLNGPGGNGDLFSLSDTANTVTYPTLDTDTPPGNIQLFSSDGTVNIVSGTNEMDFTVNGSLFGKTITGNTGGPLSPVLGNWNIVGNNTALNGFATYITGSGNTLLSNSFGTAKWVVNPIAGVGTHTTIQSAITTASSGDNIFITQGTYTENLTLKSGVNLIAYAAISANNASQPQTRIIGTHTLASGLVNIHDINLQMTSVPSAIVTLSSGNLTLVNCSVIISGAQAFVATGGVFSFQSCYIPNAGSGSSGTFNLTNATARVYNSYITVLGNGSTLTGNSGLEILNSTWAEPVITSDTSNFFATNSNLGASKTYVLGGIASNIISNCYMRSFNQTLITVGTGAELFISNTAIQSTNTNPIDGLGIINFSNLSFTSTGSGISTTTQIPMISSNDAVKVVTPAAYPYTTVPQDYLILVDTSSARTINLSASPVTGQRYVIKDSVGSAVANNITITPAAGNIDGAGSATIATNYGSLQLVYNGSEWSII